MMVREEAMLSGLAVEFAHHLADELHREGIAHTCGSPFRVQFLNRDGRYVRRDDEHDIYQMTLTATCSAYPDSCIDPSTAYNYARVEWTASSIVMMQDPMRVLDHELKKLWRDLMEHLRQYVGGGHADIAEWLTNLLAKGSVPVERLELPEGMRLDRIMDEASRLGFVRRDTASVGADGLLRFELPMTPWSGFVLGLPDDHPLAEAA